MFIEILKSTRHIAHQILSLYQSYDIEILWCSVGKECPNSW